MNANAFFAAFSILLLVNKLKYHENTLPMLYLFNKYSDGLNDELYVSSLLYCGSTFVTYFVNVSIVSYDVCDSFNKFFNICIQFTIIY